MMREALAQLDRQANERAILSTKKAKLSNSIHIFWHNRPSVRPPKGNEALILRGLVGRAAGI